MCEVSSSLKSKDKGVAAASLLTAADTSNVKSLVLGIAVKAVAELQRWPPGSFVNELVEIMNNSWLG